jgi:transposase InsO family protein
MREIRTLRATWRGLETWNGRITTAAGAPVLDPTCERLEVKFLRPTHPYIRLDEEFAYLAVVSDAFSRRVIGWELADHLRAELALAALHMALASRTVTPGLIHHSDRGIQGELNWLSQHPEEGGCCDDRSKTTFGTIWAAAIVVTRSTAGGRTR